MIPITDPSKTLSHRLNKILDDGIIKENKKQKERNYLGGSRLGHPCDRKLQYEYTKIKKDYDFNGKILRIFDVGHVFEEMALKWLRISGFSILNENSAGDQFGFSIIDDKIRGHVDGIITDAPNELGFNFPMLWECKSMNDKNWNALNKRGLLDTKPIYAVQIAIYQKYMNDFFDGINKNPALFMAINKNTSEPYFELVYPDDDLVAIHLKRALIIFNNTEYELLSNRMTDDPNYWECRYCEYRDRCWA